MRLAGRLAAAIEILDDFARRRAPLKTAIADWGRANRYAGAKDRAWISGLCLDALRRRNSLAAAMGDDGARALALATLRFVWKTSVDELSEAAAQAPHGPGALSEGEYQRLARGARPGAQDLGSGDVADAPGDISVAGGAHEPRAEESPAPHIAGDFPQWLTPQLTRLFGEDRIVEAMSAFATRADVDLRLNTLKQTPEKALAALKTVQAAALPILTTAARIQAPDPAEKAPGVTVIPAFNKGWVEVQDLGSQIAAAAAGDIAGAQALDYCAGGGGKTLALSAMMANRGQLFAYDRDARRLKPLYARARRAGLRNLQILDPREDVARLDALKGRLDVVFLDAPCTGLGTWRRHPDAKWRLTEQQLARRMAEQDIVLREGASYPKAGGRLIWVTCSPLIEENEDRLAAFLDQHKDYRRERALERVRQSGLLTQQGAAALAQCETANGDLRLTPDRLRADGFFIAALRRDGPDPTDGGGQT